MGCIVVILAMFIPRVVMFFIWLLTDWFGRAYETVLFPLVGFFLLPYTTLAYMAAVLHAGGLRGGWIILVVVAVLVDIGHWGGSGSVRRKPPARR